MSDLNRIARFYSRCRKPERAAVNIVAFGDSVTQGAMELGILSPREVYHHLLRGSLERFFPVTTFNVINSGVSGETTEQAKERLERDVISHQPDLVIIALGLNDAAEAGGSLQAFKVRLTALVDDVLRRTTAAVVLLSPPAMATQRSARIHPKHESVADLLIDVQNSGVLKQFAQAVAEVARMTGVIFVDIYNGWERLREDGVDCDSWLANGLNHPDKRGHQYIHALLWHVLMSEFMRPHAILPNVND